MGAVEDAVDAAAQFIGPFIGKSPAPSGSSTGEEDTAQLVKRALSHLQAINAAEQAADPNAPYDGSLVGVVYGLLDLITSLGILPHLSSGVAFSQRPRSVLVATIIVPPVRDRNLLSDVVQGLFPVFDQGGTGIQPLLSQRVLPDIISALAELSFSPRSSDEEHISYARLYTRVVSAAPPSRLLPVLTSLLQHDIPVWWKPVLSNELALVPLRPHGVRHTIEFLSLSYLSKNSQVPQDASGPQTQIPLPLEAITQASKLLSSVPSGMTQDDWFTQLAPQLLTLLDGAQGKELSRAAGQIIAGGILNKKSTGAPKTVGWELFAKPLQQAVCPVDSVPTKVRQSTADQVLVDEQDLQRSLRRLAAIASSYSHAGLLKRLVGPCVNSLWGLLTYASSRPSLDKEWSLLPRAVLLRYLSISCEPRRIDTISDNLFSDGDVSWTFGPGSQGGVEIRQRSKDGDPMGIEGIFSRIGMLDERVNQLVTLLVDANIKDDAAGAIFLQTAKKWLAPDRQTKTSLIEEADADPLSALVNAKLSEALATKFQDKFARSPQHIIELMDQLLQNFARQHQTRLQQLANSNNPSRANLRSIVQPNATTGNSSESDEVDELASFAISILSTLVASRDFKRTAEIDMLFSSILPSLQYLARSHTTLPIPPLITNAAANALQVLNPASASVSSADLQVEHRATLKAALNDLTSPEPPIRTWALSTLRKILKTPAAFPVVDVPSLAHALLSASIADPESYVHVAAIPVLVDLAVLAPNPTVRILVDAFTDIDERSLRLRKEKEIEEALDYRLRVGEILNNLTQEDQFWQSSATLSSKFASLKLIVEGTLSLASRRVQRTKTRARRGQLAEEEKKVQEEGEAAWDGPIPNLLDPDAEDAATGAERDALLKILQGWEGTGIEEDVRIRASALSILGGIMETRLELLSQVTVDAALQMALQILTVETAEAKGILRRAAVLVFMGLLRGMDELLEDGKESVAGLKFKQTEEVERVIKWTRYMDTDDLVKDHAQCVLEGLETWKLKKLYRVRGEGLQLGPNLGLEGILRGLDIRPLQTNTRTEKRGLIVEEIE